MTAKRFSKELYTENDTLARAAGKRYWLSIGCTVEDNPDRYGPDLIVTADYGKHYCEVEIKRVWSGKDFQYPTLQIPARKQKNLLYEMPCTFIVFNNEQTHGFLCTHIQLVRAPIVEVPNKYVYAGEKFFQIPINELKLIEVPSE